MAFNPIEYYSQLLCILDSTVVQYIFVEISSLDLVFFIRVSISSLDFVFFIRVSSSFVLCLIFLFLCLIYNCHELTRSYRGVV